jgi:xanthine dehydrogenase accessory factor
MAFSDAAFDGDASLDGVNAQRMDHLPDLAAALRAHALIPVLCGDLPDLLAAIEPGVLIDARMRKRSRPEAQIDLAPLTIGLGPNFVAGQTTHLAVETGFGEDFGRVYEQGSTRPLEGEPPPVLGHGRERFTYAPHDGLFRTDLDIRAAVRAGDEIARIDDTLLTATLDGVLRGLTHDGVPVVAGTRVIEIDPRGDPAQIGGIGPRQRRVAEIVLAAIEERASGSVD